MQSLCWESPEREGEKFMSKILTALRFVKKSEPSLKQSAWYFWY
ncbi:hypothetical protein ACFPK5_35995 [Streptomyces beijiangensis]